MSKRGPQSDINTRADADSAADRIQTNIVYANLLFDSGSKKLKLRNAINDVLSVQIQSVEIPFSWYTITAGVNDQFQLIVDALAEFNFTVTPGNYTGANLATILTDALALNVPAGVNQATVTWNNNTSRFQIDHATPGTVTIPALSANSIMPFMGFTVPVGPAAALVSDTLVNLTGPQFLIIQSNALSTGAFRGSTIENSAGSGEIEETNTFLKVNVKVNPSFLIAYEPVDQFINYELASHKRLNELDFLLLFPDTLTPVDLQGQNWSMTLKLTVAVPQ